MVFLALEIVAVTAVDDFPNLKAEQIYHIQPGLFVETIRFFCSQIVFYKQGVHKGRMGVSEIAGSLGTSGLAYNQRFKRSRRSVS